jgi:ADP-ribose pyrophosphatase
LSDSEQILQSRKFRITRQMVDVGSGQMRQYDIIRHDGAAVILPLLDDGKIVFERNFRLAVEKTLLELPAGTIDPPEEPITCAGRELAEETGYRAGSLTPLCSFASTPGICDEMMHAFVARDLTPGEPNREPGEQIELTTLSLDEALQGIENGAIIDAKTIVTILYYSRFVVPQGAP